MASADLSRRIGKVVGYPPLSELDDVSSTRPCSRRAPSKIYLGSGQAAILTVEENRPKLRLIGSD